MAAPLKDPREDARHPGWGSMVFAVFGLWIFVDPIATKAGPVEWALTILGFFVFLAIFSVGVWYWVKAPKIVVYGVIGLTLLGVVFAPFNGASVVYYIYAASIWPFAVRGDVLKSSLGIGAIIAVFCLMGLIVDNYNWLSWLMGVGYCALIGGGNVYSVRKTLQLERFSKTAERERIARDLHDVLGHTLSVIILKAELAGRLIESDPQRARTEIGDVERISRKALSEVRDAIRGYRSDLQSELQRARAVLHTAGLTVEADFEPVDIAPEQERVLSLALREAVTNVLRHAKAKRVRLQLQKRDGVYQLEVHDDGRGGTHAEGSGMSGMRERLEAFGGQMRHDGSTGTRLTITLPATAVATGSAAG